MARAAKLLREFVSIHLARIEDAFVLELLCFHRRDMVRTWSMARFTGYSGHEAIQLQLISVSCAGAVTRKAIARFVHADPPAGSHFERWRYVAWIANGDIETLNVFVEAEATFVERAIVPEDVRLARLSLAKRVEYRLGDCVNAIGYGVEALVAVADDLVSVWSTAKRQPRMRAENFARSHRLECSPHRRQVLSCRFFRVAFGAGLGPGVPGVFFTGTPGRGPRCFAVAHARPLSVQVKYSTEAKQKTDCDEEDDDGRGFYSAADL